MKALARHFLFCILCSFGLFPVISIGQTSQPAYEKTASLPQIFMLGEYDKLYEEIMPGYNTLLESCDGDLETAFGKLYSMMVEIEAYAKLEEYDLKGIKAWMHFFWREDGTIEHIGFHLKPNSRNADMEELTAFLSRFASQYRFPHTAEVRYAHYSTFSFPVN